MLFLEELQITGLRRPKRGIQLWMQSFMGILYMLTGECSNKSILGSLDFSWFLQEVWSLCLTNHVLQIDWQMRNLLTLYWNSFSTFQFVIFYLALFFLSFFDERFITMFAQHSIFFFPFNQFDIYTPSGLNPWSHPPPYSFRRRGAIWARTHWQFAQHSLLQVFFNMLYVNKMHA